MPRSRTPSHRRFAALAALVALVLGLIGAPPAGAQSLPGAHACGQSGEMQCGAVTVPRDWAAPHDLRAPFSIAVSVVPARSARQGVLLVNPGGPGTAGIDFPEYVAAVAPDLLDHYDIVGFDPRGVGASSPHVQCNTVDEQQQDLAVDVRDRSGGGARAIVDMDRRYAGRCVARSESFGLIDTWQAIRDLDAIRAALGVNTVDVFGTSAASTLGLGYAAAFPGRVGRMVLDAPVDPTKGWLAHTLLQAPAFQRRFAGDFLPWAAAHDAEDHLGATPAEVATTIAGVRSRLTVAPTVVDGIRVPVGGLDQGVTAAMYQDAFFPYLAAGLRELTGAGPSTEEGADAARLLFGGTAFDADDLAGYNAYTCNDGGWGRSTAALVALSRLLGTRWPTTGFDLASTPCAELPAGRPHPPVALRFVRAPVLLLSTDRDPAAPHAEALSLVRALPSATLVDVPGGDHGSFGDDPCATVRVEAFLLTGATQAVCPAG